MREALNDFFREVQRLFSQGKAYVFPCLQRESPTSTLQGLAIEINGYLAPKMEESFADCADRYAYNETHLKFAIADGVSKSFFPQYWSDILVKEFVKRAGSELPLKALQEKWHARVLEVISKPETKYFVRNAFKKNSPGFATFVGLEINQEHGYWNAIALGDSFLFFVPANVEDEHVVFSSLPAPYTFDNYPNYFSSVGDQHKGEPVIIEKQRLTAGTFLLATDALAEWILRDTRQALKAIQSWNTQADFEVFVREARNNESLHNDDTALLSISISLAATTENFAVRSYLELDQMII